MNTPDGHHGEEDLSLLTIPVVPNVSRYHNGSHSIKYRALSKRRLLCLKSFGVLGLLLLKMNVTTVDCNVFMQRAL